jgi:hypothetical protein
LRFARSDAGKPFVAVLGEQRRHPVHDLARLGVRRFREQERELVAADAERVVGPAQRVVEHVRKELQRLVTHRMTEAVVELLETVEVAEHERERALVARRARSLAVEPLDERAPVQQPRQRVVVGKEPQLVLVRRGDDRGGCLVREDAERLQLLLRREETILRLVGPDQADHLAGGVAQRHDEPVPVPRARPLAVAVGGVRDLLPVDAALRLLAREQEAACDLEFRVEECRHVADARGRPHRLPVDPPPHRRARLQHARLAVDELGGDVFEAERIANAATDVAQDLVGDGLGGEARGDLEQLLEREPVARGLRRLLRGLDRERGVVGE